ncbi:MAG: 5-formyltetrahydrofolate cyclo-ligase [Succinivibrio sp.]|uniref:5-formyltetrahydrofolate cyclo-ligase n=1 Tax=Succinivibrio faecicola TaxID=2820300 RepID=A0ABS7DEW0_9GAMM|nr:5-formyltetrahydrofolate cyclo-ligase [Succinivibrio faecicola]MBW7569809.1 5-formyltetrahydrofolate cyclo-ligase [Succinivibrio faecicola]MCI6939026.1 5-formyltetrahydrofolate cyclo-ligase [Succinatimonas hippei]
MDSSKEQRNLLRQEILAKRRQLTAKESAQAGLSILKTIMQMNVFKRTVNVASYISLSGELCTQDMNEYFMTRHHLCLPYMVTGQKGKMDFYSFKKGDELVENRFHILEPKNQPENLVLEDKIDVIVVPLVAFDNKGNRMGMGGGYYDRMLKKVRKDCLVIGVAYEFQQVDELLVEEWDMPMDIVITEKNCYEFRKQR